MTERSPLWAPSGGTSADALLIGRRPGFGVKVVTNAPRWAALCTEIAQLSQDLGVSGDPEVPVHLHRPSGVAIDRYDQVLVIESDVERWAENVGAHMTLVASPSIALTYQARIALEVAGLLARPDQREYGLRRMALRQPWLGGNNVEAATMQVALAHLAVHSKLPSVAASMLRGVARSQGESWNDLQELAPPPGQDLAALNWDVVCRRAVHLCLRSVALTPVKHSSLVKNSDEDSPSRPQDRAPTDEELLLRCTDRSDDHAFQELLARHYRPVYALVARMLSPDEHGVDDLCNLVFQDALQDASSFTRQSSVRAWLMRIAAQRVLDGLRTRRREIRLETRSSGAQRPSNADAAVNGVADAEHMRILERALQALSPENRHVVLMRYQHGMSWEEIASITEVSVDSLRLRVARALRTLRRAMEAEGWT